MGDPVERRAASGELLSSMSSIGRNLERYNSVFNVADLDTPPTKYRECLKFTPDVTVKVAGYPLSTGLFPFLAHMLFTWLSANNCF